MITKIVMVTMTDITTILSLVGIVLCCWGIADTCLDYRTNKHNYRKWER
ncbi:MAG: hypothetical protein K5854_09590 [Prevotella sp.]|nr:hypothetical protein [Prevotella sp.]